MKIIYVNGGIVERTGAVDAGVESLEFIVLNQSQYYVLSGLRRVDDRLNALSWIT